MFFIAHEYKANDTHEYEALDDGKCNTIPKVIFQKAPDLINYTLISGSIFCTMSCVGYMVYKSKGSKDCRKTIIVKKNEN